MTETIRAALDSGNVTCGIFVDFQKAFDTVNHEILLKKTRALSFTHAILEAAFAFNINRHRKENILKTPVTLLQTETT